MRSDLAIQVENLGKSYTIGHKKTAGARADTMRDAVAAAGSNFARTLGAMLRGQPIYDADRLEEFWALQDVSFDIRQGEAVGIIGRNGAGKSTLLKVLSRITEPSRGRVRLRGRVASLLEVGTGFHPELSGRENIFLNGAILGMSRAEVQRKFDEIIDFAGVERFLDTPVKRYSSGMYVRLAFAVAAHLEPEILVVDEVLAVGDAEFQKKCLGKMNDVASHGRTVLFVSHNISAISALCEKGIFLRDGKVNFVGPIAGAISAYLDRGSEHAWVAEQIGGSELFLTKAQIVDVKVGTETVISVDIEIESKFDQSCAIEFLIKDQIMTPVAFTTTGFSPVTGQFKFATGNNSLRLKVCLPQLALGRYHASIVLSRPVSIFLDRREDILTFTVDHHESGSRAQVFDQEWGCGCFSGFIETTAIA